MSSNTVSDPTPVSSTWRPEPSSVAVWLCIVLLGSWPFFTIACATLVGHGALGQAFGGDGDIALHRPIIGALIPTLIAATVTIVAAGDRRSTRPRLRRVVLGAGALTLVASALLLGVPLLAALAR